MLVMLELNNVYYYLGVRKVFCHSYVDKSVGCMIYEVYLCDHWVALNIFHSPHISYHIMVKKNFSNIYCFF